jgi:L-threonylcarbamoyladenylate synthase
MKMATHTKEVFTTSTQAVAKLMGGKVGVMPTDTVYGVVARAHDQLAVDKLYKLKHRERKPGTLIAADLEQLKQLGVSQTYLKLASKWWPNPLSIILPVGNHFAYLHQDVGDIAIRVVDDEPLRKILKETGPLLTSSAHRPGEPGSTDILQAWNYFEDTVDFYVDGGDLSNRAPSTIIRLSDAGEIIVLREGAIKLK